MNLPTFAPAAQSITPDTPIMFAGQAGATIAMDASGEIESITIMLQKLSQDLEDADAACAIKALAMRIDSLNSLVMSYMSGEGEELTLTHYGDEMWGGSLGREYVNATIASETEHVVHEEHKRPNEATGGHLIGEKRAAGTYVIPDSHQLAGGACLSPRALADIEAFISTVESVSDVFLNGAGEHDACVVNILDAGQRGFAIAKDVQDFDDAWHRLVEAKSLLHGAIALAEKSEGTALGAMALLHTLNAHADTLSDKFDGGGVHYKEHQHAECQGGSRSAVQVRKATSQKAVAA